MIVNSDAGVGQDFFQIWDFNTGKCLFAMESKNGAETVHTLCKNGNSLLVTTRDNAMLFDLNAIESKPVAIPFNNVSVTGKIRVCFCVFCVFLCAFFF